MIKEKVDIIITSFLRDESLMDLLKSILRDDIEWADNITVGLQTKERKPENIKIWHKEIKVIKQPFDCGLAKARNILIEKTKRPYILLLEDDFLFCKETDIDKMFYLLYKYPDIGVVGGVVKELGQRVHFEHRFRRIQNVLRQIPDYGKMKTEEFYDGKEGKLEYKETGCVLNFAMFNREVFDGHAWDEKQKLAEHTDFYLRWPKNWKIVYTPSVVIDTVRNDTKEYRGYKARHQKYMVQFMKKHNLKYYIYKDGFCYYWNDKEQKLYQTRENKDGKIL